MGNTFKPSKGLLRHLSLAPKIVAVLTGFITIVGAGYSVYRFVNPTPDRGTVAAVILDGETGAAIAGAKVEILSTTKALIAALDSDHNGRVRYQLKDGRYNVRISYSGYAQASREVQITPGQTIDLAVRMTLPTAPVKGIENTFKKIIGR